MMMKVKTQTRHVNSFTGGNMKMDQLLPCYIKLQSISSLMPCVKTYCRLRVSLFFIIGVIKTKEKNTNAIS